MKKTIENLSKGSSKLGMSGCWSSLDTLKWRKVGLFFTGKMAGLFIVMLAMMSLPGIIGLPTFAAQSYTATETSLINTSNTIWTLVAAFLVFGMQAGFVMLEA